MSSARRSISSLAVARESSTSPAANGSGSFADTQRPNWNDIDATLSGPPQERLLRAFDTSQFTFNAPFTFGNAPRMMPNLRCNGVANFDISVFKNTQLTERIRRPNFGVMQVEIAVNDPKAYTKPWSVTIEMAYQADTAMLEEICMDNEKDVRLYTK